MRKLAIIVFMMCGSFLARSQSATIQWSNEHQTIEGFGASDAWLADDIQKHAKANEIMDIFFKSGTGIELSILRQRVSPYSYNAPGQWDWSHKDFVGSSWVAKAARNRGVSKIWASCWTAPKWMKANNSFNNGGSLYPNRYDDYAEFLSGWVQRMKSTQGVTYYGISAQNEPGKKPWESMEWTKNDYKKFVKDDLIPAMNRKGLGGVKIMYPESTGWEEMSNWDLSSTDVQNNADIFCGHNYGEGNNSKDYTGYGKPVWHTEWWSEQQGGITGGLSLAENMHKYLTLANVNTWHYWWLATNQPGKSNGLIRLTSTSDYEILKNFYVSGQFSKVY